MTPKALDALEVAVFVLGLIVVALDLFYWRSVL